MTLLNELNTLLQKHSEDLGIPGFRAQVQDSGGNQKWLQKVTKNNARCPSRIQELLALPITKLVKED